MRSARTFTPHVELDRLTVSVVIVMFTLNAISILPALMMDQPPFPASLSLGVALVLVLRFDRRFAAYHVLAATVIPVFAWLARGGSSDASIPVDLIVAISILQGLSLLAAPWLLGGRRRDLVTASPAMGGVLRLFLLVIPCIALLPAVAVLLLAGLVGERDPLPASIAAAVQTIVACYATAPFAMALLTDESGRRCHSCHCQRRWVIIAILAGVTGIGLAHHPTVAGEHVLMQTLLALGSLSLLIFLAVLSGWMATAAGAFLLAFTTDTALVGTAVSAISTQAAPDLIATSQIWVAVKTGTVLPVIAIALFIASLTEVHLRDYRRLKAHDGRLGGLLDDAATGLIRTDERGRILFANEAAVRVIGSDPLDPEAGRLEVLIQTLIAPQSHRRLRRGLRSAARGRRFQCELGVNVAEGPPRLHLALFSPVRDPDGAASVLVTMIDVDARERSSRRRSRREAERTRDAQDAERLDRMTSLVMSDVNNLATALAGVSSLARDERSPAALDHMLVTLEESCATAARHAARLRHTIPGAAVSSENTDVTRHLRDRLQRAATMGRIDLDRIEASTGLRAPVPAAFLDLLVEELVHDLESADGSPRPRIWISIRPDRTAESKAALNIEFGSSRRRATRSITALTGRRRPDAPTHPATLGLVTIVDGVEQIGGSIDVEDHDGGTIVAIRLPIRSGAGDDEGDGLRTWPELSRRA